MMWHGFSTRADGAELKNSGLKDIGSKTHRLHGLKTRATWSALSIRGPHFIIAHCCFFTERRQYRRRSGRFALFALPLFATDAARPGEQAVEQCVHIRGDTGKDAMNRGGEPRGEGDHDLRLAVPASSNNAPGGRLC